MDFPRMGKGLIVAGVVFLALALLVPVTGIGVGTSSTEVTSDGSAGPSMSGGTLVLFIALLGLGALLAVAGFFFFRFLFKEPTEVGPETTDVG